MAGLHSFSFFLYDNKDQTDPYMGIFFKMLHQEILECHKDVNAAVWLSVITSEVKKFEFIVATLSIDVKVLKLTPYTVI